MRLVSIIVVTALGVLVTLSAAVQLWRAARRNAPTEVVVGYAAMMIAVSAITMLMLRLA